MAIDIEFTIPIFSCVSCEDPIPRERKKKVYCSDFCREEAKHVRYFRRKLALGEQNRPDIKLAMRTRLAGLQNGGYISLRRIVSPETRSAVKNKFQQRCAKCGNEAIPGEIDHISDSSNEISNLQLLCWDCHMEKTQQNIRKVSDDDPRASEIRNYVKFFMGRVSARDPRGCDDHERWDVILRGIEGERKIEYFLSLNPILRPMIEYGMSNRAIMRKLNELEIPTISGSGSWGTTPVRELIELNR